MSQGAETLVGVGQPGRLGDLEENGFGRESQAGREGLARLL